MKPLIFLVTMISSVSLSFSQNVNYVKEEATGYHGTVIKKLKAIKGLSFCVIGDWGRGMEIITRQPLQRNWAAPLLALMHHLLFPQAIIFILMEL